MKIDRYFDPKTNFLTIAASVLHQIRTSRETDVSTFLRELETKFPGTSDNYAFEALGLLFLLGKIRVDEKLDTIGYDNEAH